MALDIGKKYLDGIQNCKFDEVTQNSPLPISSTQLNALVNEVATSIISASDMRESLEKEAGGPLSLRDVCCLIVQDTDRKNSEENKNFIDTPTLIENASLKEKIILSHAVEKLNKDYFAQLTKEDLQKLTLLFGIRRAHEFATQKIIPISSIEELRNKFSILFSLSPTNSVSMVIATVDEELKKHKEKSEEINAPSEKEKEAV